MDADANSRSDKFKRILTLGLKPKRKTSEVAVSCISPNSSTEDSLLPPLQYDPLEADGKSVRLLEILLGRDPESIQTRLHVCDLNQGPHDRYPYIALSYMWDQGARSRHIECDGKSLEVGENLWQFLQQYRRFLALQQQHGESSGITKRLWIDAISINQQDLQERGQQVALMRNIYTGADSVIVWLGLAEGFEELAFLLTRHPALIKVDEMLDSLTQLLNKPYWKRVWVVQEFVLARTVDIWCGSLHASAKALEDVWRNRSIQLPYQIDQSAGMQLFRFRRKHRSTAKIKRDTLGRRNSKTFRSTIPLRELLDRFHAAQSSETYDKIYGFLGIATDGHGGRISPNYSIQPVELLVAVLRNQSISTTKKASDNDHKFLIWLMHILKVSRAELIRYVRRCCPEARPHLYVLTVSQFMVASISFVSTIQDIGSPMEEAEARMLSTWKPKWLQTSMHPNSLSTQDLHDLGEAIITPDIAIALDFADAHISGHSYIGSEVLRGKIISESTDLLISHMVQARSDEESDSYDADLSLTIRDLRDALSTSLSHSATLYDATRPQLSRRSTADGLARFVSFKGTNGYIGVACVKDNEILAGDRVCTFAGISDSNNAFIVRLCGSDRWSIVGFAIIVLPPAPGKTSLQRPHAGTTMVSGQSGTLSRQPTLEIDRAMCFHCHLTDLLELQRCRVLTKIQMDRMLEQTIRLDTINELHQCSLAEGKLDVLDFGV
ncbi:hypothetical protein ACN47E_000002 [Coniothyrium glycines]